MIEGICPVHPDYYEPCRPCALGLAKHAMELPKFETSAYASYPLDAAAFGARAAPATAANIGINEQELWRRVEQLNAKGAVNHQPKENFVSRIVRVIIADPNENLPLDKRILYKSEEVHTDLTDQELFFETNPSQLLVTHNAYRITMLDKRLTESTGKEHKLEPARIRDLKMVVVVITSL